MSSATYDATSVARGTHERQARHPYFIVLCNSLVLLNLATFLYHLTAIAMFNVFGNAVGVALIAYSILSILQARNRESAGRAFLLLACTAVLPSVLYNLPEISLADVLKYLSVYIFYAAGRCTTGPFVRRELGALYVLAALPVVFMLVGSSKVYVVEPIGDPSIGYLPNPNTAVLYFSAVLFAASPFLGNSVILLQLVNAALMNKIGAVLATVVAIGLWLAVPLRKESIIGALVVAALAAIALWVGAFDRAIAAVDTLVVVFSVDPRSVLKMSYAELVGLTGSTDLSGFFRLIHWANIWDLYTRGGIGTWLFGYGAGQTQVLTFAGLVPHNDYLRVLAEYGVFSLIIFVCFLQHIRSGLRTGASQVLFLVLCIYLFSENLVDNFTSMALFFGYAGRLTAMHRLSDVDHSGDERSVRRRSQWAARSYRDDMADERRDWR
jgi:hypothetical protein